MKKLLLLLPILVLVAAGCSLVQKPALNNDAALNEPVSLPQTEVSDLNAEVQEEADWQTYYSEKYGYEVKYPADWKMFGSLTSPQVAFGKNNQEKNYDGELFIRVESKKTAEQVISEQRLTEKKRSGQSLVSESPLPVNSLDGTLLSITNDELKKSIPNWELNMIIFEKDSKTYVLSNGAIKSENFEKFYKSFRLK